MSGDARLVSRLHDLIDRLSREDRHIDTMDDPEFDRVVSLRNAWVEALDEWSEEVRARTGLLMREGDEPDGPPNQLSVNVRVTPATASLVGESGQLVQDLDHTLLQQPFSTRWLLDSVMSEDL